MSWIRALSRLAAPLLCVTALAAPGTVSAAIVVASSGPSAREFPAGRKLDDSQRITLRAGDSVTILDRRGTRVLRGPGAFAVSQRRGPSRASSFVALTRQRGAQRVRTGAVRRPPSAGVPLSPNIWYVDVARPGIQCIVDPDAVRLWRANSERAARYRIAAGRGPGVTVSFEPGDTVVAWDTARSPVADGASFTLTELGGGSPRRLSFALLPSQPTDPEGLAEALIASGCTAQLELLSAAMALSGS